MFSALGGPWGALLNVINAIQSQRQYDEAKGANLERYEQGLGLLGYNPNTGVIGSDTPYSQLQADLSNLGDLTMRGLREERDRGYDALSTLTTQNLGTLRQNASENARQYANFANDLAQGYQDRYDTGIGMLEGWGDQERRDLQRDFDTALEADQANLRARGLGSSTITSTAQLGNQRERSEAMARLNERLNRERLGVHERLSGDLLGSQERVGQLGHQYGREDRGAITDYRVGGRERLENYLQNANQGILGVGERYGQQGLGMQQQQINNILSWISGREDPYPSQYGWGALANAMQGGRGGGGGGGGGNDAWMGLAGTTAPYWAPAAASGVGAAAGGIGGALAGLGGIGTALSSLGGWGALGLMASDENMKQDFEQISEDDVLDQVDELPVMKWKYRRGDLDPLPHIGPMAQDFQRIIGLGNGKVIHMVDAFGVAIASIKALSKRVKELEAKIAAE